MFESWGLVTYCLWFNSALKISDIFQPGKEKNYHLHSAVLFIFQCRPLWHQVTWSRAAAAWLCHSIDFLCPTYPEFPWLLRLPHHGNFPCRSSIHHLEAQVEV